MRLLQDTGDDAHRGAGPAAGGLPRHPLLPALRGLPGARLALQAAGGAAREVTPVTLKVSIKNAVAFSLLKAAKYPNECCENYRNY